MAASGNRDWSVAPFVRMAQMGQKLEKQVLIHFKDSDSQENCQN